jgi:hypothetical protein
VKATTIGIRTLPDYSVSLKDTQQRSTFKLKIQLRILTKNLAKELVLVAMGILKLNDSQRKSR